MGAATTLIQRPYPMGRNGLQMVDARQKIRAGIDKHEQQRKALKQPRLSHLSGHRTGIPNIKLLNNAIRQKHAKLMALRNATVAAITEQGEAIRARYDAEGWATGEKEGHRIDVLTPTKRKTLTDRALATMQKEVVALVSEEVSTLLAELNEDKNAVALARDAWSSPVSVLMRSTLASPERRVYTANLANAGSIELREAAHEAIRTQDKALGSAVLARIDRLPAETRKSLEFSKADVAETLIFEEFQGAVELLALSEYSILLAGQEGREALGQTLNASDKLALGNHRQNMETEIGRELTQEDLVFLPVVGGEVQQQQPSDIVAAAEKKAADERTEMFAKWQATEPFSPEWLTLGKVGGWVEGGNTDAD